MKKVAFFLGAGGAKPQGIAATFAQRILGVDCNLILHERFAQPKILLGDTIINLFTGCVITSDTLLLVCVDIYS